MRPMVGIWPLVLGSGGVAAFMSKLLYVGLSRKRIMVNGITYHRDREPFEYWLAMAFAALGLCFGLFVCIAATGILN